MPRKRSREKAKERESSEKKRKKDEADRKWLERNPHIPLDFGGDDSGLEGDSSGDDSGLEKGSNNSDNGVGKWDTQKLRNQVRQLRKRLKDAQKEVKRLSRMLHNYDFITGLIDRKVISIPGSDACTVFCHKESKLNMAVSTLINSWYKHSITVVKHGGEHNLFSARGGFGGIRSRLEDMSEALVKDDPLKEWVDASERDNAGVKEALLVRSERGNAFKKLLKCTSKAALDKWDHFMDNDAYSIPDCCDALLRSCPVTNDGCESVVSLIDHVTENHGPVQHPDNTAALGLCKGNFNFLTKTGWDGMFTHSDLVAARTAAKSKRRNVKAVTAEKLQVDKEKTLSLYTRAELREFADQVDELDDLGTQTMLKGPLIDVLTGHFGNLGLDPADIQERKDSKSKRKRKK